MYLNVNKGIIWNTLIYLTYFKGTTYLENFHLRNIHNFANDSKENLFRSSQKRVISSYGSHWTISKMSNTAKPNIIG